MIVSREPQIYAYKITEEKVFAGQYDEVAKEIRDLLDMGIFDETPFSKSEACRFVGEEDFGLAEDTVLMYLRRLSELELLSHEEEVKVAKRIEAGRSKVLEGLRESPLTPRAIIYWRAAIGEGKVLLRDVIAAEHALGERMVAARWRIYATPWRRNASLMAHKCGRSVASH